MSGRQPFFVGVSCIYRAEELARRLEAAERSAASERAAAAAAQQSVSRLDSELRVVRGSAAALEAEATALRQELQVRPAREEVARVLVLGIRV